MLRELARLAALNLSPSERVSAALGGAVGGAVAYVVVRLVDARWPSLFDPVRPH